MPDAVIVSSIRTPVGKAYKGALRATRPDDLAAVALVEAIRRVPGLDPGEIDVNREQDPDHYESRGPVPSAPGARNQALAAGLGRLFVTVPPQGDAPGEPWRRHLACGLPARRATTTPASGRAGSWLGAAPGFLGGRQFTTGRRRVGWPPSPGYRLPPPKSPAAARVAGKTKARSPAEVPLDDRAGTAIPPGRLPKTKGASRAT